MEIKDEFDLEFGLLIREIENFIFSYTFDKSIRIRINNWCKKLSQVSNNLEWKKNRNLHAINILNMLINGRMEEPYNKNPDDRPLQILSKTIVKSKLTAKFWESVKHIYNSILVNNEKKEKKKNCKSPPNKKVNNNINRNTLNTKGMKKYWSNNNIHNSNNIKVNNINKNNKFNSKRVKTPTMMHRNMSAIETNKIYKTNNIKKNILNYNVKPIKIKLENKYNDELKFLKETATRLEQELNTNEAIIESQKEENNALKNKIMKLTEILKTLI